MGTTYNKVNEKLIENIAIALEEINTEVVYVGGAVVYLYVEATAFDEVRPTKDIDVSYFLATKFT